MQIPECKLNESLLLSPLYHKIDRKWRSSPTSQCRSRIEPLLSSTAPSRNPTELPKSGGHHPPAGVVAGSNLFYPARHPHGIQRNYPSDILAPKRLLPYEAESLRNPRPRPRPSSKSDPKLHTRQES